MWRGSAVAAAAAIAAYAVYHHRRRRRASPSHPDKEATPDALDIGRVIVLDGDRAAAGSGSGGGGGGDSIHDIGRVISYWFDGDFSELLSTRWFVQHNSGAQRALDAHIAEAFGPLLRRAERGELCSWEQTARGRLALILLLDQVTLA